MKVFVDDELVLSLPWLDNTQACRWERLLPLFAMLQAIIIDYPLTSAISDVSSGCKMILRLCRNLNGNLRSFDFPPYRISEMDQGSGETKLEHPEAVWVATIKHLSPSTAERLLPDKLEMLGKIDGVYDSLKSNDTIKYSMKAVLTFASIVVKFVPKRTGALSFLVISKAWELLEQQDHIDDTIQEILRGLGCIQEIVEVLNQTPSSALASTMDRSKEPISDILLLLEDMSVYVFNWLVTHGSAHQAPDSAYRCDTYAVEDYLKKLKILQNAFYVSWKVSAASLAHSIGTTECDPPATSGQNMQEPNDEMVPKSADPYEILNLLRPMDPSGYDPDRACMDGTREGILTGIVTWAQNHNNSESFMWISGQAGMGKTSIATSLCQRLDSIGALAGSFFCQYDNPDTSNPLRLINNLVHEIAMQCPAYACEVARAVRMNRRLYNAHVSLRYEGLIKRPLKRLETLSMASTLVVVIDGVDECGDNNSRKRLLSNLYDMSRLVPWLRVIVTGRPTGDMQEYFRSHCPHEPIIHLHSYDASDDIRAYIGRELGQLTQAEHWPQDGICRLHTMAEGVFLWAALATNYIKKSTLLGVPRLRTILNNTSSSVTDFLDSLYTRALKTAIDATGDESKDAYFQCMGAILAISEREHLSIPDLQYLLLVAGRIDRTTLEQVMDNLSPLLLATRGQYAKFHHSSF